MASKKENVAILGASERPDRFAYRADKLLQSYGHATYLVNPNLQTVEGKSVFKSVAELKSNLGATQIDTLTLYVNPRILAEQVAGVIALKPKRVIFNPGTEDLKIEAQLKAAGIEPVRGCTLVMLDTDTY